MNNGEEKEKEQEQQKPEPPEEQQIERTPLTESQPTLDDDEEWSDAIKSIPDKSSEEEE